MKTKAVLTAILMLIILHQISASPAEKLAAANNIFAFKLLKQIAKDRPSANIFISPYSASTALQMVANGAAGQTKTEMQNVLETGFDVTGLSTLRVNQANGDIAQSLKNGNKNVILEIANSIWYRQGAEVLPGFLACNRQFFGATVEPLNFADPHSVDVINNWASKKRTTRPERFYSWA